MTQNYDPLDKFVIYWLPQYQFFLAWALGIKRMKAIWYILDPYFDLVITTFCIRCHKVIITFNI